MSIIQYYTLHLQVFFIAAPSTPALSHKERLSAGTSRDGRGVQDCLKKAQNNMSEILLSNLSGVFISSAFIRYATAS
jgi:hypothetical protein